MSRDDEEYYASLRAGTEEEPYSPNHGISFRTVPENTSTHRTYLTAAATPPDFAGATEAARVQRRPRDPRRNHATTKNPQESYWRNNAPILENIEIGSARARVPVVAPASAPTNIKLQIFNRTQAALRALGPDMNYEDRNQILYSRFGDETPAAKTEARLATHDFELFQSAIYRIRDLRPVDIYYRDLNIGAQLDFPDVTRRLAKYFALVIEIIPRQCNTGDLPIDNLKFPTPMSADVFLRIPPNAAGPQIGMMRCTHGTHRLSTAWTLLGPSPPKPAPSGSHSTPPSKIRDYAYREKERVP